MSDIVRTRIITTKINGWGSIGKARTEFFKDIKPATTMVELKRLIIPGLIVELEADAIFFNNVEKSNMIPKP